MSRARKTKPWHLTDEDVKDLTAEFRRSACELVLFAAEHAGIPAEHYLKDHTQGLSPEIFVEWLMAEAERRIVLRRLDIPFKKEGEYTTSFKGLAVYATTNNEEDDGANISQADFERRVRDIGVKIKESNPGFFPDMQVLKCWATAFAALSLPEEEE
ncbi:hypothetical protein [uncultured Paraglaciecola sp.]|uniref:hypothetical protein n=1 Tax=uncultured Paraglaciecola sp. TaxID=1765024 RepID=UPI00260D7DAB|nr:hypothetical protein [uncultured Paraglaciecola sp.]